MRSIMSPRRAARLAPLLLAAATALATAGPVAAQQAFKAPEDAASALADAVKSNDRAAILKVLGPAAKDIVESGDDVEDARGRTRFTTSYDAKHTIATEGADKAAMIIGADDYPFPVPIVRKGTDWKFDAAAGRDEILFRRIGRNELAAIQASLAYVDAQNEYADKDRGDGAGVYARHIISRPGKKDGLYWPSSGSDDESPLGEFMAKATGEGYRTGGPRAPFHGYYYKILTRQGGAAPGGALDYVVKGKMIGGFALIAYPSEYGVSGVMTFIVGHNGTIYQKDLGRHTENIAGAITAFNPDPSWKKVEDADKQL